MNYSTLVQTLADYIVPTSLQTAGVPLDPDFVLALPEAISYANNRICRDLDFLNFRTEQLGPALGAGNHSLSLATLSQTLVVLEQLNVLVGSVRTPLTPQSRPYIDLVWGNPANTGTPVDFAMTDAADLIVGPYPDINYSTVVYGTYRPAPISATTTTTWVTDNLPELFVTACMIRLSGWRKNYGAVVDEPQAAATWNQEYQKLLDGADIEEARRKFQSAAWSNQKPLRTSVPARA